MASVITVWSAVIGLPPYKENEKIPGQGHLRPGDGVLAGVDHPSADGGGVQDGGRTEQSTEEQQTAHTILLTARGIVQQKQLSCRTKPVSTQTRCAQGDMVEEWERVNNVRGDVHLGLHSLSAPIPVANNYPVWVQTTRVCDKLEHRRA
ncbi:MAG TPA: hypothetical protein VHV83_04775 [Armatimonadota bacterium]|nr:hypothetical protein [Armatimonadota bacterium]